MCQSALLVSSYPIETTHLPEKAKVRYNRDEGMTQEAAERFAQALLMQFGKEREFKFELPEGHNMEFVTAALERAGCSVQVDQVTRSVVVQVPEAKLN